MLSESGGRLRRPGRAWSSAASGPPGAVAAHVPDEGAGQRGDVVVGDARGDPVQDDAVRLAAVLRASLRADRFDLFGRDVEEGGQGGEEFLQPSRRGR